MKVTLLGRSLLVVCVGTGVMGAVSSSARGQNLLDGDPNSSTFNNPSFERPDITFIGLSADKWTLSGPVQLVDVPGIGTIPVIAGCGIFENPATQAGGRIEGADGAQLAYIFANTINDVNSGQPVDHAFTQVLPTTFEAGKQYQLAIGIANAQAAPPPNSVLTMSLFAFDPSNPTVEQLLASQAVSNNGQLNGLSLTDFFATTDLISGAAIGKQIGIRIGTHTDPQLPSATGQFDFDNVRVTIVPEPGAAAAVLPLAGAAGMLIVRNRRRG